MLGGGPRLDTREGGDARPENHRGGNPRPGNSLWLNNLNEIYIYSKHRAAERIKNELCASELGAVDRGKLYGVASESNTGDDHFEYRRAHVENNKLGAKAHGAEAGDAGTSMLRPGQTTQERVFGRSTTSLSSADG